MRGAQRETLTPEDAARLERWHAAGRPSVPLVIDGDGIVHATTTSLATILTQRAPRWEPFRRTACRWVDAHCRA